MKQDIHANFMTMDSFAGIKIVPFSIAVPFIFKESMTAAQTFSRYFYLLVGAEGEQEGQYQVLNRFNNGDQRSIPIQSCLHSYQNCI